MLHISDNPYLFLILHVIRRGDLHIVSDLLLEEEIDVPGCRVPGKFDRRFHAECFEPCCTSLFKAEEISMSSWGAEGLRALMCCFFLLFAAGYHVLLYQQVLHFRCCVRRVDPVPGKMLCKASGASMKEPPSLRCCLWWLPLNDLPAFTPAFFQAVPRIAATRMLLSPMTHAAPALATAPTALGAVRFLNTVCGWQPMFTPGASSCLCSRHDPLPGLLFSCPWSPFCLSNAAFPLHLRAWGMRFFCWEDAGLLPASPFPSGNCYSFHLSLIQSNHLSGLLLGKMHHKACVCSCSFIFIWEMLISSTRLWAVQGWSFDYGRHCIPSAQYSRLSINPCQMVGWI